MAVLRNFARGIAVAILVSFASAQVPIGTAPPAPQWGTWHQGEAIDFAKQPPACTVVAFFTPPRQPGAFAADGDAFADLQKRFGARGLAVVAVVEPGAPSALERWPQCRVVEDADGATTRAWFLDLGEGTGLCEDAAVLVLDREGKVAFVGGPEHGLVDAIGAMLDGAPRPNFGAAAGVRAGLVGNYDDLDGDAAAAADQALAVVPHDGVLWGMAYLLRACKRGDLTAGLEVARRASAALAGESRALAAFADLVLRGDPARSELLALLRPALQAAAARAAHDPRVQLALLRLLVQAGDGREVGRLAMRVRKLVTSTAGDCLDFASILTTDREPAVHRDLAQQALDRAVALQADARLVAAVRYAVLRQAAGDAVAAKKVRDEYLAGKEGGATVNNDCWYLMTEVATMGRFTPFVVGLAERMLEARDEMDAFEFDTAALALFLGGRAAEAVELQELALQKSGGNPEYERRLARYRAGVAAPPR